MGGARTRWKRSRRPLRREVLTRAAALYAERFASPDGRVRATFDLVWLAGWRRTQASRSRSSPGRRPCGSRTA
jgi:hypothetical protein